MRKIFFCCVFVLLFNLAACQTTTERDVGQYKGSIDAITSPIVMRYRPYSQSTFKQSQKTYIINGSQKELINTTTQNGTVSATSRGSDIILNIKMNDRKTKMSVNIKLTCTDRGKIRDFEMEFPDLALNPSELTELKILSENFKTIFKSLISMFPEKGVKDGDILFDQSIDIGQMFSALIPEEVSMPCSISATVRGIKNYENRQTLVVDTVGNLDNIKFGTSKIPMSANLNGYCLVDVSTGAMVYEETLMDLVFEMQEKASTSTIQIGEVSQIDLK